MEEPKLPQAVAAARARSKALSVHLRAVPPAKPDYEAERQARDRRKAIRLGVRIARAPKTHLYTVQPLVNGKAVGTPLDAGTGRTRIVMLQAEAAMWVAGRAAGLSRAETGGRMYRQEYDVRHRNLP